MKGCSPAGMCTRALQASLASEVRFWHDVSVHIASPGMVATELLIGVSGQTPRQ